MSVVLRPADARALADLAVLVDRAARADPGGAARLRTSGSVLAVAVCPVRGPGAPTVLGVRAIALAAPAAAPVDTTVELAALADRLVRAPSELAVPPVEVVGAAWAGVWPPRGGWTPLPAPDAGALAVAAQEAGARAAAGEGAGSAWAAPLPGPLGAAGGTAALARAALALGFVGGTGAQEVRAGVAGPWLRISTSRGDVVGRAPLLR